MNFLNLSLFSTLGIIATSLVMIEPAHAQQQIDPAQIAVVASDTQTLRGPINGSSPAATFRVTNNGQGAVHFTGGVISIRTGDGQINGLFRIDAGNGNFSPELVLRYSGSFSFAMRSVVTIAPGDSMDLGVWVNANLPAGSYTAPVSLTSLYFLSGSLTTRVSSRAWQIPAVHGRSLLTDTPRLPAGINYSFSLHEKLIPLAQPGPKRLVAEFDLDVGRDQHLRSLGLRIRSSSKTASGTVTLVVDGALVATRDLSSDITFSDLDVPMTVDNHSFRVYIESDHRVDDTILVSVYNIVTSASSLPTHFMWPEVTCTASR